MITAASDFNYLICLLVFMLEANDDALVARVILGTLWLRPRIFKILVYGTDEGT